MARDTKLGPEEITPRPFRTSRKKPSRTSTKRVSSISAPKLVRATSWSAKITPKGESPMTPEEKLLRAILSAKRPPTSATPHTACAPGRRRHGGRSACVQPATASTRNERAMGHRARGNRAPGQGPRRRAVDPRPQRSNARLKEMLFGKVATSGPKGYVAGSKLNDAIFEGQPRSKWWQFAVDDDKVMQEIEALQGQYEESRKLLEQRFIDKVDKLQRGDELPPGRDEDGQGLRRHQAQDPARRQDGRPSRQQGCGFRASCRSRTCRSSKTVPMPILF